MLSKARPTATARAYALNRHGESRARLTLIFLALMLFTMPIGVRAANAPQFEPTSAWVTFDSNGHVAGGATGLADRSATRQLTVHDPVRVASVSKLVVAIGVMRLVEQRRLDLDKDVSRWLGWRLRNPAYRHRVITLRMLLSHRSGWVDQADGPPMNGEQSLKRFISNQANFDQNHLPGTFFQYANLNYVLVGAVMEGATGERFDLLMKRLVMRPLGVDACFGWQTCSSKALAAGVTLYGSDGRVRADEPSRRGTTCVGEQLPNQCVTEPYMLRSDTARFGPQGSLRISMTDLAKIGQVFLNDGSSGSKRFLTKTSVDTLIRPAWKFSGNNGNTSNEFFCTYGLGIQLIPSRAKGCKDHLFSNGRSAIGHPGEAYGLLSGLWIDRRVGKGIAYFSANESGERTLASSSSFYTVERILAANLPN